MGKGQSIADYFTKIMRLRKDLDPQMSDDIMRTCLARGLPQYLKEVVLYAERLDMVCLEERLNKLEEFQAFSPDATLEK